MTTGLCACLVQNAGETPKESLAVKTWARGRQDLRSMDVTAEGLVSSAADSPGNLLTLSLNKKKHSYTIELSLSGF